MIACIAHLIVLYRISAIVLASGVEGLVTFALGVAVALLLIITLEMVRKRASAGRRIAIVTFALIGLGGIYNGLVLYSWPEPGGMNLFVAKVVLVLRIVFSFTFVLLFALSKSIDEYFSSGPLANNLGEIREDA